MSVLQTVVRGVRQKENPLSAGKSQYRGPECFKF